MMILTISSLAISVIGQIPNADSKRDFDADEQVENIADSLVGIWELEKTIRYENGDTIIQEPSHQLWLTPEAKPFTTIKIDSLRTFYIEQSCMKCRHLKWKGKLDIQLKIVDGHQVFHLNFIDERQNNLKKTDEEPLASEFNGHLISYGKGELRVKDKESTDWVYRQQTK